MKHLKLIIVTLLAVLTLSSCGTIARTIVNDGDQGGFRGAYNRANGGGTDIRN